MEDINLEQKRTFRFNTFIIVLVTVFSSILVVFNAYNPEQAFYSPKLKTSSLLQNSQQQVLAKRTPELFLSAGSYGYTRGGLLALSSKAEPKVYLDAYDYVGDVKLTLYQADKKALLDHLVHDDKYIQLNKPNSSELKEITSITRKLKAKEGKNVDFLLPLEEQGVYLITVETLNEAQNIKEQVFLIRSKTGVVVKEGDDEFIFWGQDFNTLRSVDNGEITLYNFKDSPKQVAKAKLSKDGIAKMDLKVDAEVAFIERGDDLAVVPINLQYLNTSNYPDFVLKEKKAKYFVFTDRPLYRPGDTVYFKAIIRNDDDARYSIPNSTALVKVGYGYGDEDVLFEKNIQVSKDGTISGEVTLPESEQTGSHYVSIDLPDVEYGGSSYFSVEHFRKPEYFIDTTVDSVELIKGDMIKATVKGEYFSGQPVASLPVKYSANAGNYYDYQYYAQYKYVPNDDYRYGYWGSTQVKKGSATFDKKGRAIIEIDTKLLTGANSQVVSIESEFDDGSGNPSFSRKNILVHAGEFDIFREETSPYYAKVNTPINLPLILVDHKGGKTDGIDLKAKVTSTKWIPKKVKGQKYDSYIEEKKEVTNLTATSDANGKAKFSLTPTYSASYKFEVTGIDSRGNTITKSFGFYVGDGEYVNYDNSDPSSLDAQFELQTYRPTDTAKLMLVSKVPDRDVLISFDRDRTDRFQVVKMKGTTASVNLPLEQSDLPNVYLNAQSFSIDQLDSKKINLQVSTETKKLFVDIKPNAIKYGPGENVTVDIVTSNAQNRPISAEVTLWAVDKALFELVDENLGDIFDTFWQERYYNTSYSHSLRGITDYAAEKGGGCFVEGTKVLMGNGNEKKIENVNTGDIVLTRISEKSDKLVKAKVLGTHKTESLGYLIINQNLKVTPNHIMFVNGKWSEASKIKKGDNLVSSSGEKQQVVSVEWHKDKAFVYNLTIEKYNTYFADGVYVHNQKGGGREIFKDTAYWNPSIKTNENGKAQVTFKLPDNLTTWTLAAVGSTVDTRVGQSTNEIVVTKDVVIRPILPNILRVDDKMVFGAIVQNFTDKDQTFEVSLKSPSNDISQANPHVVQIKAQDSEYIYWNITPQKPNPSAKLTYEVTSTSNKNASDKVTLSLPIKPFSFIDQSAQTGNGNRIFDIDLKADSAVNESSISVSLAPSLVGSLAPSMKYLIEYPYGCVEQTTSRFVPVVVAKTNSELFGQELQGKELDDMLNQGVERLADHQNYDGGWSWWGGGANSNSSPFVTAYVVEYLVLAKNAGYKVDDSILNEAKTYLQKTQFYDSKAGQDFSYVDADLVAKSYGLTLLGEKKGVLSFNQFTGYTPDIVAMAVMSNYLNGDTDPKTNGLDHLISMAIEQGDTLYWDWGYSDNFGSRDAPTALAVRAILMAKGDNEVATKGMRYLINNRSKNYWSNTFSTAQVIRTVSEFAKAENLANPNYDYVVELDNKQIASGRVNNTKQKLSDINIPASKIKESGSKITIKKDGTGQLYSTLLVKEVRTDKNAKATGNYVSIQRFYKNDKGPQYTLAVGDVATVQLVVKGLISDDSYAVIDDQLPAGLVPINANFNNQQFNEAKTDYYYDPQYNYAETHITENGAILSIRKIGDSKRIYTYKARVVNEGEFIIPPATVELMYNPEYSARTDVQTIKIEKESSELPSYKLNSLFRNVYNSQSAGSAIALALTPLILVTGATAVILVIRKRKKA